MKIIACQGYGERSVLQINEQSIPQPSSEELLIRTHAIGVNRADILQRQGKYPPPEGASSILGLEFAGEIVGVGKHVEGWQLGQRVMGLVSGGAYAEYVVVHQTLALPIPDTLSYVEAAAVTEAFITAHETVFELGQLQAGETLLLHAAGSGIGTTALQMAVLRGAQVIVTAGSTEKLTQLVQMGALVGINYKTQDITAEVGRLMQEQGKTGVDVVEDFIGGENFKLNLQLLKPGGRLIQVASMAGRQVELDLTVLMRKHLQIKGFVLRHRGLEEKAMMTNRLKQYWLPLIAQRKILPIIDSTFMFEQVQLAHQRMEEKRNFGKIVLIVE